MTIMEQLKERKEQRQVELQEKIANKKLEIELAKLGSPLYEKKELQKDDIATLDAIISEIEERYIANNRKINHVYSYGVIPNKILTIVKAIQYSNIEEKQDLLLTTGLSEQVVEDTIESLGNTTYFDIRNLKLIPEIPMDIPSLKQNITSIVSDLNLVSEISLNKFNTEHVNRLSEYAKSKAEEALQNTLKYNEIESKETVYSE